MPPKKKPEEKPPKQIKFRPQPSERITPAAGPGPSVRPAVNTMTIKPEMVKTSPVSSNDPSSEARLEVIEIDEAVSRKSEPSVVKRSRFLLDLIAYCREFTATIEIDGIRYLFEEGRSYFERLYMKGYNLSLHKLYPEIKFPVSRNTASISPLIKWDYRRDWFTYQFDNISTTNIMKTEYIIAPTLFPEQKYIEEHVIDGRNLIPAAEYLLLVWKTFAKRFKSDEFHIPVVFENCRFHKATAVPKNSFCSLVVSIQKASGRFEISEKSSIIATGRIYSQENEEELEIDVSKDLLDRLDRSQVLEQDEIYRELYLRGYNYRGNFKGLLRSSVDVSIGLVRWENNFTTFIDNMFQMKILEMDTRLLYVPSSIRKITIDPKNHVKRGNSLYLIYNCRSSGIIKSGAIEVCGFKARSMNKRKLRVEPVLEKYVFVSNQKLTTLDESLRVNTQIILENSLEINFKAVEILDYSTHKADSRYLLPFISNALDDHPMVHLNLIISTKAKLEEIPSITIEDFVLTPTSSLLLIIATNILDRIVGLKQVLSALSPKGFLLTREEIDFSPQLSEDIQIITEYVVDNEKLILLRKIEQPKDTKFIEIASTDFDWISQLQAALKSQESVVVYSQKQEADGILGFINCIRREPQGAKIRCFFIKDEAPKFDPENPFYVKQLKKNLAINIYERGTWGTYRHLLLEDSGETKSEHVFANTGTRGDLSSLRWYEGNLHPGTRVNENQVIVFPYYCPINFKDIMTASGRVNRDDSTTGRTIQESIIGIEFCGIDMNGRRVAAIGTTGSLSSIVVAEKSTLWEIPDDWSLEDAATVYVVYLTVLFSLHRIPRLKPGMSILIHSATGGVGRAALNVCLHHGLEIFVTVGTRKKKGYLRRHYPQILESHIGNSRDTSFEQMIKFQTKGRGVDIVLNSLSEEKLRASTRCVASGGDFLEIGKYDMDIDEPLKTSLLERKINFHGVMLDRIFNANIETQNLLVKELSEGVKLGYVKPLPRTVFQKDELKKAFRYMMTGQHTGKVLIKLRDEETLSPVGQVFKGFPRFVCDPEKSYIIIGGLGGFGLELADWLYLRGARNLVLVSRIGIQTGYQVQRINIWTSAGVSVKISTDDVTTKEGCLKLIKRTNELAPIDGVFNLAAILKDALFADQTPENFRISLAPKAQATIFLDEITRTHCPELKYFVIFSSIICGRGNAGQTNYGMANSIMERICEKRKREGLPGLAIQWGAIGDVGLVVKMQKDNNELTIGGTLQQKISSCLEVLDKFLKQDNPVVASMIVAPKNTKFVIDSAVEAVAFILGIRDIKRSSHNKTFAEMGMDSMTVTEMLQILEKKFHIFLSAAEIRNMTLAKLMELEEEN